MQPVPWLLVVLRFVETQGGACLFLAVERLPQELLVWMDSVSNSETWCICVLIHLVVENSFWDHQLLLGCRFSVDAHDSVGTF